MSKCAWVTTLVGGKGYLKGIITLQHALHHELKSAYPLLVLHTSDIAPSALTLLEAIGCRLKTVEPIRPDGPVQYSQERFRDTWTKLVAWDQVEYDRLVLMDADMLPLRNMDALMTLEFPQHDWIAACPACTCNPQKMKNYPADWTPEYCAYTYTDGGSTATDNEDDKDYQARFQQSKQHLRYFNSGLVVLNPDRSTFQSMLDRLNSSTTTCLNSYTFPDQDFLNLEFKGRWTVLPYVFNALKAMVIGHRSLWDIDRIYNLHYILSKPWQVDWTDKTKEHDEYYPLYQLWEDAFNKALEYYGITMDVDSLVSSN